MAKKKKNRKVVLFTSCLMALIIVASSTFAWFTSQDEVTNRLTSTADYGVSIVESFAPPANWIPGQAVNKDVYATNTGNIAAFVEEEVSGKLTVSFENPVSTFGLTGITYVQLSDEERTAAEAGGYLIWTTSATETLGEKNVKRSVDDTDPSTKWSPSDAGFYIFRRAIDPVNVTNPTNEAYTLEGYYYNGTDYYKIAIQGNTNSNSTTSGARTPVAVKDDGNGNMILDQDPVLKYVTLKTVTVDAVGLTYEAADGNTLTQPRLVANYTVPTADTTVEQAQDTVNIANAQADVDAATALVALGQSQVDNINALVEAVNNVQSTAAEYVQADDNKNNATNGSDAAAKSAGQAVKDSANNNSNVAPSEEVATPTLTKAQILASTLTGANETEGQKKVVYDYLTKLQTAVTEYNDALVTLQEKINAFDNTDYSNATKLASAATTERDNLLTAYTAVSTALDKIKAASGGIEENTFGSGLNTGNTAQYSSKDLTALNTYVNTTLKGLVDTYIEKAGTNETNTGTLSDKKQDFKDAVDAYNAVLINETYSAAVTAYETTKSASFDTKNSEPVDYSTLVASYKLADNQIDVTDANILTSATNASPDTVRKTAVSEAAYKISFSTGLTSEGGTNSKFHEKMLGAKTSPAADSLRGLLETANTQLQTAKDTAESHNDTAAAGAQSAIKINIYLDSQVGTADNNTWKHMPQAVNATVAKFYLNSLLSAGETSAKLVDKVELDPSVSDKYKDLTFDLDVKLNSAQVTYDEYNNITNNAATSVFDGVTATVVSPTDENTAIKWN